MTQAPLDPPFIRLSALIKWTCCLGLFLGAGCTSSPEEKHLKEAASQYAAGDYGATLVTYQKVVRGYPKSKEALEAARKGAKVAASFSKDYAKNAEFLRAIILLSKDSEELLSAQKQLAEIYFDKMANYQTAIVEFSRLLEFPQSPEEAFKIRYSLSKCFFYLGQFDQAVVEIDEAISKAQATEDRFQGELLKANIFTAQKKLERAIPILSEIISGYPDLARRDNVAVTLSMAYEEKGDFEKAIQTLEEIKETQRRPEFIELRIDKLKERRAQMPGAAGLRK